MLLADLLMTFGPLIGYVSQYKLIQDTHTLGNFSIDVCAILLISNILRVFYWYAERFSKALLFQAIFMIIAQLILLRLCVRVRNQQEGYRRKQQQTWKSNISFWRWDRFESYVLFLSTYTFSLGIITLLFVDVIKSPLYGQVIGFTSLAIEATLGFPQMIKNFTQKNVEGVSLFLIFTWFIGDFSKTLYFVAFQQPLQFTLCGSVQLTVDLIILGQLIVYRKRDIPQEIGSIEVVDSPPHERESGSGDII